jgi:Zyg-11 family protein
MQINPTIYHILYQLNYLEYLDISNDSMLNDSNQPVIDNESDMNKFLRQGDCLMRLKHFDISGQKIISSVSLYTFLLNHPNLQFLGLFLTNEKYSKCIFDTNDACYSKYRRYTHDIQHIPSVALTEDDFNQYEPFLFESLTRYHDRSGFVQKVLYYIFFLTRSFQCKQQNYLIELILNVMSIHNNIQSVQMASTACIYNLTRTPTNEQINVKYLGKIVQASMNVMATFPDHQQVRKS